MLQPIEASLTSVWMFVNDGIVRKVDLAGTIGRNDHLCIHGLDRGPQSIAVIGFVSGSCLASLAIEKVGSLCDIVDLTGRTIGRKVRPNASAHMASGTPQRLIFCPPLLR